VVDGDTLVEKEVKVGLRNWAHAEIVSGLSAGDAVVSTLDRKEVAAGARVTIEKPDDEGR
jgi:HlyD family secretion protein